MNATLETELSNLFRKAKNLYIPTGHSELFAIAGGGQRLNVAGVFQQSLNMDALRLLGIPNIDLAIAAA